MSEPCPDCQQVGRHADDCHVLWAESLNDNPTNVQQNWRPNPFLAMLKEPTSETKRIDTDDVSS